MGCRVGAENQTWAPLQEQQVLLTTEPSLQSLHEYFPRAAMHP